VKDDYTPVVEASPTNTYPYLVLKDNTILSETDAILQFIGSKGPLAPENELERAQITQWFIFSQIEIGHYKAQVVYPIFGYFPYHEKESKSSMDSLKNLLKSLDKSLTSRKFLLGEKFTVADIELWSNLKHLWQLVYVEQVRTKVFPNVDAWFQRIAKLDVIVQTFGQVSSAKVAQKAPKVEKHDDHHHHDKKDDHHHHEKKDEKKHEEGEDDEEKPVKGKAEPEFPPTEFNFDAFKKDYYNNPERKQRLHDLLTKEFDKNAFSIYYVRYQKTKNEGKELWKEENRIDFFLQKIDQYRKYSMSAMAVYGVEGEYDVRGVWMWRGKGVPFFMEQQESFEYYDKRELNPDSEEDRALIEAYWLYNKEGEVVNGLPLASKIYHFK